MATQETTIVNFKGSAFFFPPPFLRDVVLNTDTTEPLKLILISVAEANIFDRVHEDDEEYNKSSMTHIKEFSQWVCGVKNGKVLAANYMLCPKDVDYKSTPRIVIKSISSHH